MAQELGGGRVGGDGDDSRLESLWTLKHHDDVWREQTLQIRRNLA
jgi:hypothetical protein